LLFNIHKFTFLCKPISGRDITKDDSIFCCRALFGQPELKLSCELGR
jgi:hypothetical protein